MRLPCALLLLAIGTCAALKSGLDIQPALGLQNLGEAWSMLEADLEGESFDSRPTNLLPEVQETVVAYAGLPSSALACEDYYEQLGQGASAKEVLDGVLEASLESAVEAALGAGASAQGAVESVESIVVGLGCVTRMLPRAAEEINGAPPSFRRFLKVIATLRIPAGTRQEVLGAFLRLLNDGSVANVAFVQLSAAGLDAAAWAPQPLSYVDGTPNACLQANSTQCPPQPTPDNTQAVPLPSTELSFRVDSLVENSQPCTVFWKKSMPKGRNPPAASIRLGLRAVSDAAAERLGLARRAEGGVYRIARMSNLCTNPPRKAQGKARRRKRMSTTVTPRLPNAMNAAFLLRLREAVGAGELHRAALAWGAGEWAPKPFTYASGTPSVCMPGQEGISGACAQRWQPSRITPLPGF